MKNNLSYLWRHSLIVIDFYSIVIGEPLLQIQLQPNFDYSKQYSFIYLCELFYCNSFLGVIADFCWYYSVELYNKSP